MKAEKDKTLPELRDKLSEITNRAIQLRDLLLEAATTAGMAGDMWGKAESLLGLAKNADALRESISAISGTSVDNGKLISLNLVPSQSPPNSRPRKNKDDFPKYAVRGDSLIKTGLGRDRRTEYEHIVSQSDFNKILQRLASLVGVKTRFTAEIIQDGLDCPIYQTYIVLAVLRERGFIVSERRGQYAFKSAKTFISDVSVLWNELSTHL